MRCVFTESSELMFWCTNPSNEVCELSLCEESFQVLGEEDDIRRSRKEKNLSLGMPKASFLHQQTIRSSLVRLYFYFFTLFVLFLERQCGFVFSLFLFCLLLYTCWILALLFGRDTLRFFIKILLFFTYICWVFLSSYC